MKAIVSSLFALVILSSCAKKIGNKDVVFKDQILPIFVTNCTMSDCHNSLSKRNKLNLTSYEGIMQGVVPRYPLLSEVYTNISGRKPSMPTKQYPKLSSKDVELIKLWINMGATNSTINLPCDSSNVTFSGSVKPIFTTWCVGCHNTTNPGKGVDLTNYESIIASVNSGQLLGSIKHIKPYTAMPQNTDKLSDCDIAKIAIWIRQGAPNN